MWMMGPINQSAATSAEAQTSGSSRQLFCSEAETETASCQEAAYEAASRSEDHPDENLAPLFDYYPDADEEHYNPDAGHERYIEDECFSWESPAARELFGPDAVSAPPHGTAAAVVSSSARASIGRQRPSLWPRRSGSCAAARPGRPSGDDLWKACARKAPGAASHLSMPKGDMPEGHFEIPFKPAAYKDGSDSDPELNAQTTFDYPEVPQTEQIAATLRHNGRGSGRRTRDGICELLVGSRGSIW